MTRDGSDGGVIVSYLTLRRVVGILGISLPIIVAVWGALLCNCLEPTISDYYRLRTRDALVGILFTVGWFLFTYRGYERKDEIAGNLACAFALGVALFPSSGARWEQIVHLVSAALLFLVLAYFSFCLFTQSAPVPTPEKRLRNRVYRFCGVLIVVCLVLIGVCYRLGLAGDTAPFKPVFWLETLALWAFGFSWFVKGETLWKDRPVLTPG